MAYFQQGNMEAAQANFEALLTVDPKSGPASFRLSLVRARQGRFGAAVQLAEQSLALDSERTEILTHLARCHLMCGQPEIARGIALRALALPRDNAAALDLLGAVMTRLDERLFAIELFDQAIALDPQQASLWFNRALAQKQFGAIEDAERDLESCLALAPEHAKAHWTLATLKTQDQKHNHVPRLRERLALAVRSTPEDEWLALALFKELDDLGDVDSAWPALERGIHSRRERRLAAGYAQRDSVDALIALCAETFSAPTPPLQSDITPVFIFGLPRSGVAVLGKLLSRHSGVHHLGALPVFSRLLSLQLGRDSMQPLDTAAFEQASALDLEQLGRRYLAEVSPASGGPVLVCESYPMNFQLAAFIARALPGARMLHMAREPMDNCVAILGHAGGEANVPGHDPAKLADYYLDYDRLMQHWHQVVPGRIIDVSYESLVAKPEMVLRVICGFLGIRYDSAMRLGLQPRQPGIGRGHRYAARLPALSAGLASLERKSRSA